MIGHIGTALRRGRKYAASIFAMYALSSTAGILMAHGGNPLALASRDRIVNKALAVDAATIAHRSGAHGTAIVRDFAGNVLYAAIPQAVAGLGIVLPYVSVAMQGWSGGVVSVDRSHRSRFRSVRATAYYFLVLTLQFIPFSLVIGAGVRCGVELYRANREAGWQLARYRLPGESFRDAGWSFVAALPLFLVASAFEFLSPWNV